MSFWLAFSRGFGPVTAILNVVLYFALRSQSHFHGAVQLAMCFIGLLLCLYGYWPRKNTV